MSTESPSEALRASRYELLLKLASGGMATVYVGRLRSTAGFWRLVAIKRAHAHLLEDASFKQMLIEEARLASRIHHANVVSVLDVEELRGELCLVMDYIEGASLSELSADAERPLPARLAVRILLDACAGLHAAHELTDDQGKPAGIVHRDVSPHNILVGVDGTSRLSDFGIAKVAGRGIKTTTGTLKGKVGYMAPEYVSDSRLDARSDIFSMGVVAWEVLANAKLFRRANEMIETLQQVVSMEAPPLSTVAPWLGKRLDSVIATALEKAPENRFQSAKAFAHALETAARRDDLVGSHEEVAAHVKSLFGESLERRRALANERMAALQGDGGAQTSRLARPAGGATGDAPARTPFALADGPRDDGRSTLGGSGISGPIGYDGGREDAPGAARARRSKGGVAAAATVGVLGLALVGFLAGRAQIGGTSAGPAASGSSTAPPPQPSVTTEPAAVPAPSVSASLPAIVSARGTPAPKATAATSARAGASASARGAGPTGPRPAPPATAEPGPTIPPNPYAP
jgi:serine/threonine-protein kinase